MWTSQEKPRSGVGIRLLLSLAMAFASSINVFVTSAPASAAIVASNLAFQLDPSNTSSYTSGTTWYDLSGLSHNFTMPASAGNQPSFQSGPPKSFLFTRVALTTSSPPSGGTYFSGTHSWLGGNDFTVSAWIKTTSVGASTNHWELMQIMSAESGGGAWDWGFGIDSNGKLAFGTGLTDTTFASPSTVNTGNWTYVAATRTKSNGVIRLYVNGSLVYTSSSTSNTSALQSNSSIRIGAGDDGGMSFGGNMGAIFAYTTVLSDAQITQNFDATKGTYGFKASTTTTLSALNSSTQFGLIDTLTATVNDSSATGTVNFLNNGSSIVDCTSVSMTLGVATCAFSPGSVGTIGNLTAAYSGDSSFNGSTSSGISITVTIGAPTLTLMTPTSAQYRRSTSIFTISSPAGTDGKVTFTVNGKKIGGCINLPSATLSTQCRWLPSQHAFLKIGATLVPTNSNFGSASALPKFISVLARNNFR